MSKQPGGDKVTRYIVIGMVVFIVAVGVIFSFVSSSSKAAPYPSIVSKSEGYGIVFNGDLKNVPKVDIWEDMQCPFCGRFEGVNGPYIQKLIKEKKATIVFHMLSFAGPESVLAANAIACSADEGKFLQYHEYLYATQSPTENSGKWSTEGLLSAGSEVGLTSSTFKSCVADGTYGQWVKNVADDGASKNINATPTVFKDGQKLDGNVVFFDPVAFAKAIEG